MGAPASIEEFLDLARKSGVVEEKRLDAQVEKLRAGKDFPREPAKLAGLLVRDGLLTHFQAEQLMQGKWRKFHIGKYKVLERLGAGGMGSVYLCEHKVMRRRVAVKVLPTSKASDPSALERFYREARAVAALDHPNIVHAYDIDQDENLHFLVMEYVDGASLQDVVKKTGPMEPVRAANYIRQAAQGLEHAHSAGLVHRDIKPGNILVERTGVVKILDMGLARFFNDEDDVLTKKYDENVLGTADYLAPEQALDSHGVDIRADIYSLGATFYYLLTGHTPFGEGTVAQKLIWHQTRNPKPLTAYRTDVPPPMAAVIEKMMAKDPGQRYQNPGQVDAALLPWAQTAVAPPVEAEMPHLSPAATGSSPVEPTVVTSASPAPQKAVSPPSPRPASIRPAPAPVSVPPAAAAVKPTSAPTMAAMAPTVAPPAPEDVPWEKLASDTEDPSARVDTPSSESARKVLRASRARAGERRRMLIIGGIVGLIGLGGLAYGFILFFGQPAGPPPRPHLVVTHALHGRYIFPYYSSITRALTEAQSGDIIEIHDEHFKESLTFDARKTNITIQAAPGKQIHWKPGNKDKPLLNLSNAQGFILDGAGITLDGAMDGKTRIKNLVVISGKCPGLTLKDLALKGFSFCGVHLVNCSGEGFPVRLLNLNIEISPADKVEAAIYFDAVKGVFPAANDYIDILNCTFPGFDSRKAVKLKTATVNGPHVKLP